MPKDVYGEVEITYDMLAARSQRFVNYIIDALITAVITFVSFYYTFGLQNNTSIKTIQDWTAILNSADFMFFNYVIIIVFYGLLESLLMRTPGKYATDTMVVMRDGTQPTSTAILIRTLCRLIPFEFISFFGRIPIGLHDAFSKTVVVDVYKYNKAIKRKNNFKAEKAN